ncbi:MAG TPA: hypothetical protein VIJ25_13945 [Methylococcales bacterium]
MQGFAHSAPAAVGSVVTCLEDTVSDVAHWCSSRRLQLNATKTEIIWFGSSVNLSKLDPADMRLHLDDSIIEPVAAVRDLGVYLDSQLSMRQHVSLMTRTCYYQLRRLRSVRRQLGRDVTQRLVSAFILSRLDYCNALLAELPAATLAPLQRVQNCAARLVLGLKPWDHITSALIELHWLPIRQRIIFKLCILVHKSLNNHAPRYLSDLMTPISTLPSRAALRSASTTDLDIPATRLCFGERAFSVAGAKHWNSLPEDLRNCTDNSVFKRLLKTHLFKTAFDL